MDLDKREVRLCRAKNVLISSRFDAVRNVFSGQCRLAERLENIIAMRVHYFNITLDPADLSDQQSTVLLLASTKLGGYLSRQYVMSGVSVDSGIQNVGTVSGVIGRMVRNAGADFTDASAANAPELSQLLPFTSPTPIDTFDWAISPLGAAFPSPMTHPYEIAIMLSFYSECTCQSVLKEPR